MVGSDHKFPLCGKKTNNNNDVFCNDCQDIAQKSYSEELLKDNIVDEKGLVNHNENDHLKINKTNTDKYSSFWVTNKNSLIFLAIGLILMILIGTVGSYTFLRKQKSKETELIFWGQCVEENSVLSYSKYLVQYPEGEFSTQAYQKIESIREDQKHDIETLKHSHSIEDYLKYLSNNPNSTYDEYIRELMDSLCWAISIQNNTLDAYKLYIEHVNLGHFKGTHLDSAQEQFDHLNSLHIVQDKE